MTTSEKGCVESTVKALDQILESSDAQTDQALNAARLAAIGTHETRYNRHWLWAFGSAVVLVLVVGIYSAGRNGSEVNAISEQLVADAELYQDMEFYTWLAEELESDQ